MYNRRRHYRIYFPSQLLGKVRFLAPSGEILSGKLIDLSAGGVKCLLSGKETVSLQENSFVEKIQVFPRRLVRPILAKGILRRIMPDAGGERIALAFEFSAVYSGAGLDGFQTSGQGTTAAHSGRHEWISRLQQTEVPRRPQTLEQFQARRQKLQKAFEDVAARLSNEDRWWFFLVLEALKSSEFQTQKGLFAEYLHLCRKAVAGSETETPSDWTPTPAA